MKKILPGILLMMGGFAALPACDDPTPDYLTLRQLNTGPAGANLNFNPSSQLANIAVGTALAFDCDEQVRGDYRSECGGLAVENNSRAVTIRTVYRPRTDGSASATSAFAIVGMEPGTVNLLVRTSANEYTLTVNVVP